MPSKTIVRPKAAAPAVGPYNLGVRIGDLLFCAGQIPINPAHPEEPFPEEIRDQARRVLENLKLILEDQGLGFGNVVKTTVFLTDLREFAAMNEIYAQYFKSDYPARSTIQVAALPRGARVEIEAIAHY